MPRALPPPPAPPQTSIYLASSPEVEGVSGKVRCPTLAAPAAQPAGRRGVLASRSHNQAAPQRQPFSAQPLCHGPSRLQYFDKCRPVTSSRESYDADVARRLWDASAELVGLDKLGLA